MKEKQERVRDLPVSLAHTTPLPLVSSPVLSSPQASSSLAPKGADQPPLVPTHSEQVVGLRDMTMSVTADAALPAAMSVQGQPSVLPHGTTLSKLRSISTPAQQLRQKDEQIEDLQSTISALQEKLAAAEQKTAAAVSAAVASTKAALEQDLRSQASALETALADLEACKTSADLRERQHQVSTHGMAHCCSHIIVLFQSR
jgi:hypothetical protein